MLGGLSKKATYLDQYRKEHGEIITVDSGDLLNEYLEIKESVKKSVFLKADLTARAFKQIGIDAVNVGELDLVLGLDYLRELEANYGIPFVSASLVDGSGKLVFKPYVIKDIGKIRVAIFGLMGDTPDMISDLEKVTGGSLTIREPIEAAQSVIDELKGKVDFIIAMTHNHMGRNWVIARKVDGIDLLIGGHHTQRISSPYEANNTYMVQAGEKGQYQGMIDVTIHPDGTREAENELAPLGTTIPDDVKIRAMIDKYNQDVASIYVIEDKGEADAPLKMMACEQCHSEAVEVWLASDHAKAFQTLVDQSKEHNPECLACHTTLFDQPGGFNMALQQAELRNVQCDTCHGNSDMHLESFENLPDKKADMASCMECHTDERCPDFEKDYTEIWWEKIKH